MTTLVPPTCMVCRNLTGERACTAFTEEIPDSIWLEGNPHTEPVDGDHGIRFEAATGVPANLLPSQPFLDSHRE
jgi:hypothetical protein